MVRGVRARITSMATIAVVVVLVLASLALLTTQRQVLTDVLDESLTAHASELASLAAGGRLAEVLAPRADDDGVIQVVQEGLVVASTANVVGRAPLPPPLAGDRSVRTGRLLVGEPTYRIASLQGGGTVVHVAAPTDDIAESVHVLRVGLLVAVPAVAALLGLLVWVLVGRTLQPVEEIRREVAEMSGSDLALRVPEPATGDEVERLARTMNGMLDRIERASVRQQRFVADASHELRIPLTRLRAELEVDLRHPERADLLATHRSILEETVHLQRLVEDLLILARHDARLHPDLPQQPVDLERIVEDEVSRRRRSATVRMEAGRLGAAPVLGHEAQLARVVGNLLDNATTHAHSVVSVALSGRDGRAVLSVSDDGPGIPPEDRDRVFERFTRLDDARTRPRGGAGLGLSIVREIVERHGGAVGIDGSHAPGARFVVELPLADRG